MVIAAFEEILDYTISDIDGTLTHAPPTPGQCHYKAEQMWATTPMEGAFVLETVSLHEIGHLLGLGHSSIQGAIMYPTIPIGIGKTLLMDN